MQKQLITFPDGSKRYIANKLRIGAGKDDRNALELLGGEPEADRYPGPTVDVKTPATEYEEIYGIESGEHFAARNYGLIGPWPCSTY